MNIINDLQKSIVLIEKKRKKNVGTHEDGVVDVVLVLGDGGGGNAVQQLAVHEILEHLPGRARNIGATG